MLPALERVRVWIVFIISNSLSFLPLPLPRSSHNAQSFDAFAFKTPRIASISEFPRPQKQMRPKQKKATTTTSEWKMIIKEK